MSAPRWIAFLAVVAIAFVSFEGYALATGTPTLSRFVWEMCAAFPLIPFAVGVVCGHLFWPRAPGVRYRETP